MDQRPEPTEKSRRRRHALTVVGAEYAGMARETTAGMPGWFRPVAMGFIYAYGLLMTLFVAPVVFLMLPKLRRYLRLTRAVSSHVQRVWQEESPVEALAIAQRVLDELARDYPRRVRIPPYGAASSRWALGYIADLLYSGYVALGDWQSALRVAETVLEVEGEDAHWKWLISKAKALRKTGSSDEARSILHGLCHQEYAGLEARRVLDSWEREAPNSRENAEHQEPDRR
jgi:hypothetical protein